MSPRCQPVVFDVYQMSTVLGAGMGYNKVFAMCATAAMVGLVIYGAMYLWLRRTIPALARAT